MTYLIGVDGGGTGCRAAIADMSGKVLGSAKGGSANIATNLTTARQNILSAVEAAFADAGVGTENYAESFAIFGLAGSNFGTFAEDFSIDLPFKKHRVVNDSRITLEGAIGAAEGCIAAIGTGSVFAARNRDGVRMLGGWGFLLGDDGSGATLGQDLLRRTILAADKIYEHSDLTRAIMAQFGDRIETIVEQAAHFSPRDFGQFAPQIIAAAKAGDAHGTYLFECHTDLVRRSIDASGFDPDKPFCMLGGLGEIYLKALPEKYQNAAHAPKGNALDGAMLMAQTLSKSV